MKLPNLAEVRKGIAAAAGLAAYVIERGVLHGTALHWVTLASEAAAAVLVYVIPNAQPAAPVPAPPAHRAP